MFLVIMFLFLINIDSSDGSYSVIFLTQDSI
jgi:hypothetical protein